MAPIPPLTPPMSDYRSKSFEFAADATKQLITVATGVVTITVIFSKDLNAAVRPWALTAWIFLTISVACGLAALFTMSGQLATSANAGTDPNLYAKKSGIRKFSGAQIIIFLVGMIPVVIFGFKAMSDSGAANTKPSGSYYYVENPPAVAPPCVTAPPQPKPTVEHEK